MLGKVELRRKLLAARWMDLIPMVTAATLEDNEGPGIIHLGEDLSICPPTVCLFIYKICMLVYLKTQFWMPCNINNNKKTIKTKI